MVSDRDKELLQCRKIIDSLKEENKQLKEELLVWQNAMKKLSEKFDRGVTFNN
jgi:FtsZ-binding cell division protein ZapB